MKASMFRRTVFLALISGVALVVFGTAAQAHEGGDVEMAVQCTSLDRTVITYNIKDIHKSAASIGDEDYITVSLTGEGLVGMDAPGNPHLPAICRGLMIPDNGVMSVRVLETEFYDFKASVAPHRGPIVRSVDPRTVPYTFDRSIYGADAFYPAGVAKLRTPYIMRDVRAVVAEVFPVQYNPVTKTVRVHSKVVIEVVNREPGGENTIDRSTYGSKPDRSFAAIYQNNFVNYSASGRTDPPSEDGDILVISHGPFMATMQGYVDWKNSIGINTTMVDVSIVGNNTNSIANYIENAYNQGNLAYVLLVGDNSQVKSSYYSYGLSDPDYTCITPDWYPDLFIGRFSGTTPAHIQTQVDRTISYEQQVHDVSLGGWHAKGLAVASNQGPGHYGEYDDDHCDLMSDELIAYGFTNVTKSYDYWGTKTIIKNALNSGVRTVNYTGHGGTTGWGNGGGFSCGDVNNLTNEGYLPFVSSVACSVGDFSYSECFCESWQRATHNSEPTGAIANYGSSIGQYWDEPMYGQGNHGYSSLYGANERFWMETNWSVTGCWFGGSCIMMDICGQTGRDMFMTWICFGDPAVRLTGTVGEQTLTTDGWAVPVNSPVDINFYLAPGLEYAGHRYVIFGGVSGSYPGTTLPGGVVLPVNWDIFTNTMISLLNTSLFQNFWGMLDASGEAMGTFSTNGFTPIDPRMVGVKLYFAGAIYPKGGPYEYCTNAKVLTITQ